tara:strand:+ start:1985 stop:3541 length:1557 start_codon:yes stop_codon:yes gene_type:complete
MGKKKYDSLEAERKPFLDRARDCSKLTLPLIIRDEGDNSSTDHNTPHQSLGARGVLNLSSNLMLSLFPSNMPFFRLLVSSNSFEQFGQDAEQIKLEVENSLSDIERIVLEELEDKNLRPSIIAALQNLIISGNCLVYVQPDGGVRTYTIEDYVCHRDVEGNIIHIITKEIISADVAKSEGIELPSDDNELGEDGDDKEIELYTCVHRKGDEYYIYQEVEGNVLKQSELYIPIDELPFIPLRLSKVTGESYGRGYVETTLGDLSTLEGLSKAQLESAAILSKVIFMVDPASTTRARSLSEAENGDVINGRASDVTPLVVNKNSDLSTAFELTSNLERRLSYAYNLLDASLPTKGMTTATEINAIVNSLEKVLAGTYALLSNEFMRPLIKAIMKRLNEEDKIPELPKEVKLIISTGITNLGRTSDLERLQTFVSLGSQMIPEMFTQMVNPEAIMKSLASAIGIDKSILKTEQQLMEEVQMAQMMQQQQQEQEQAMMQQQQEGRMAEKAIPHLIQQQQQQA